MLGRQCCENPPTRDPSCGSGSVQEIAGFKTYVTGSEDSKVAILLISDAFGYEAPNLRKLADKVADATGYLVVAPDFYHGDPIDPDDPGFDRVAWLEAHAPDKGCEDARAVISALKSKGISDVGAAGFCWGGTVVAKLAKFDCIKAGVVLHPGRITEDEIKEVKCPIALLGAENDELAPPDHLKRLGEILSAKPEIDSHLKIFPGVAHGWTTRYNDDDEFAVKSAHESHSDLLGWFAKHLK